MIKSGARGWGTDKAPRRADEAGSGSVRVTLTTFTQCMSNKQGGLKGGHRFVRQYLFMVSDWDLILDSVMLGSDRHRSLFLPLSVILR